MTASLLLFHGTVTELLIKDQLIFLSYKTHGTNFPEHESGYCFSVDSQNERELVERFLKYEHSRGIIEAQCHFTSNPEGWKGHTEKRHVLWDKACLIC